ncbi:MAG TPA: aminotransferase class V-fold PLP-dependent enzyme, partial [Armatimonadota bacterium]
GGGQEGGLRSGTLNVPGIVGLGAACELCQATMEAEARRLAALRDLLSSLIRSGLAGVRGNGAGAPRLPGSLNLSFEGVEGESLLMGLEELCVSSGSACTSGSREPSYVLKAMGLPDDLARAALRFGLGRSTTEADVRYAAARVLEAAGRLRGMRTAPGAAAA